MLQDARLSGIKFLIEISELHFHPWLCKPNPVKVREAGRTKMTALNGIRVLDFGRYVAGPYCATLLADFGADVIRIDRIGGSEDRTIAPATEHGEGALFLQINRNKRSLTLDTRKKEGQEIVRRLVESADIVVSNVPAKALQASGIDFESLKAIKPDIILVNISSFGHKGPWADRPGFDSVGQAMCGSAYLSGPGDTPYRTPITWVDHASAVYAAFGAMVALHERNQTGRGQEVGGSLLGSALAYSATFLVEQALAAPNRTAIGNRSFLNGPTDTFATQDGWIVTQVVGDPLFRRWVRLIGEPEWHEDARFTTDELRGKNGAVLSERMANWCAERTSAQALEELGTAGIPAGPVLSPQQALEHPQVEGMGFVEQVPLPGSEKTGPLLRAPLDFTATPPTIRHAAPLVGEHNAEILAELGYTGQEIEAFEAAGVI
jgi:crotonobetainyl-CoA:carnitine CoA-transferase CaiB-like acyl-CoA transferase